MSDTKLLTIPEVIAETGLSRSSIYRLARLSVIGRAGGLPVVRCGRVLRFPRKALAEWIEQGGAEVVAGVGVR